MNLLLEEIYTFDLRGQLRFGFLPEATLISVFKDGRASSGLLTALILDAFAEDGWCEAKRDQKGFDFRHPKHGLIEMKQLTDKGWCFAQSGDTGKGRKVDRPALEEFILSNDLKYLVVSTVNFPVVTAVLRTGRDILRLFPQKTCKVSAKQAIEKLNLPANAG